MSLKQKIKEDFMEVVFEDWWSANKDNHLMWQEYDSYKQDCVDIDVEPMSFDDWGKEFYTEFIK